jgi:hypothetical protein
MRWRKGAPRRKVFIFCDRMPNGHKVVQVQVLFPALLQHKDLGSPPKMIYRELSGLGKAGSFLGRYVSFLSQGRDDVG